MVLEYHGTRSTRARGIGTKKQQQKNSEGGGGASARLSASVSLLWACWCGRVALRGGCALQCAGRECGPVSG
jgi:hypothetical protein